MAFSFKWKLFSFEKMEFNNFETLLIDWGGGGIHTRINQWRKNIVAGASSQQ